LIKKLNIPRKNWLRGTGSWDSYLLKTPSDLFQVAPGERKQCCIGIFATQLGIPDSCIKGQKTISGANLDKTSLVFQRLSGFHSENTKRLLANFLYETNDNKQLSEPERESLIAEGFSEVGITVVFYDEEINFGI
jgi:hypothetical protein